MKIRIRTIILLISLLLTLLASVTIVFVVGNTYPVDFKGSPFSWVESAQGKITEINYEVQGDSISIKNQSLKDGEVHFEVVGESTGTGGLIIEYTTDEHENVANYMTFYVSSSGTVIRTDNFNFNGYKAVIVLIVIEMFFIEFVMVFSFAEMLVKSQYTYSMIAYGGVGLFFVNLLAILMYEVFVHGVPDFQNFVSIFSFSAEPFVMISAPLVAVLAVAVSVSNIVLMRKEGFHPYNALGIFLSILWAVSFSFLFFFSDIQGSEIEVLVRSTIYTVVLFVTAYFECMIISTMFCAYMATRHKPLLDRDYIIILGCAIRKDGTLTPLLRDRVESALKFERRQFAATGKHACFVPSGGQGSDEVISESEAMKRYLVEQGVPEEQIIKEDKSVNTLQNLKFSKEKIEKNANGSENYKAAFATTGYHVFRGYILAKKNELKAEGIASKTKWYFFPNAFLREFAGLLFDKRKTHLLVILLLALFCFLIVNGYSFFIYFIV